MFTNVWLVSNSSIGSCPFISMFHLSLETNYLFLFIADPLITFSYFFRIWRGAQNEIDWAASDYSYHYNDVEPVRSGLMQNPPLNVETSHHSSSSVTVSIFGALSEILSHTTESLSFLTSTTTEHTPQSHTHSTFLSTDNTQIQKIQSDQSRPITDADSTTSTEFRLPILNAFDSNEASTSSYPSSFSSSTTTMHPTSEQVDTTLPSSSYSQTSTTNAFSSTASLSQSARSDKMLKSRGVIIVLATSDKMLNNNTSHAIHQTEAPFKMQINTEAVRENSTMPSTHQASHTSTEPIPIYTVYASTMEPTSISLEPNHSSTQSKIDRPDKTTPMPSTMTMTTTTVAKATDLIRTETTTERSANSVNISLYDLANSELLVNNKHNAFNYTLTTPSNQNHGNKKQTMTNTETNDLTTIQSNTDCDHSTINTIADQNSDETSTISMEDQTTIEATKRSLVSEPSPVEQLASTPVHVPRFANRIAVLPIGFYSSANAFSTPSPPIVASTASPSAQSTSTASPQKRSTTPRKPRRFDFVVYGILPNNTVIRRYPEDIYEDERDGGVQFVYGILANNTVLRKYPNGTTTVDEKRSRRTFEITDIDPKHLFNPNSSIYQASHRMMKAARINDRIDATGLKSNNHSLSTNQSPFNLNIMNTTSAPSTYNNANSSTTPPTVFKLPIINCFVFVRGA